MWLRQTSSVLQHGKSQEGKKERGITLGDHTFQYLLKKITQETVQNLFRTWTCYNNYSSYFNSLYQKKVTEVMHVKPLENPRKLQTERKNI